MGELGRHRAKSSVGDGPGDTAKAKDALPLPECEETLQVQVAGREFLG